MADRNKNKIKAEINKAVQTASQIIKPTSQIKQILENNYKDSITQKVDKVHQTLVDTQTGQEFILTQFNKDLKSNNYRSPYTNKYYPVNSQDFFMPSPLLRDLQQKGNLLFDEYARLYYGQEGCISNFYVFETQQGLNFAFYIKKLYKDAKCYGVWCSSNQIEVRGDPSKSVSYKLQSSALYELNIFNEANQQLTEVYGSLKKNVTIGIMKRVQSKRWSPEYEIDEFHLLMTGKLVQEMETTLRQQIQSVFIAKTKEIVYKTRYINTKQQENDRKKRAKEIAKMRSESSKVIDL